MKQYKTKRYFTIQEICELTDYYEYQISEWMDRGMLKSRLVKKNNFGVYVRLISRTDLYEFLNKQKTKKAAKAKEKLLNMIYQEYMQILDELETLMREGRIVIRIKYFDMLDYDPLTLLYETEL